MTQNTFRRSLTPLLNKNIFSDEAHKVRMCEEKWQSWENYTWECSLRLVSVNGEWSCHRSPANIDTLTNVSEERRALEPIGITEVCGMEYHSSVTMVKGQKVNRIIFGVYFSKSIVFQQFGFNTSQQAPCTRTWRKECFKSAHPENWLRLSTTTWKLSESWVRVEFVLHKYSSDWFLKSITWT